MRYACVNACACVLCMCACLCYVSAWTRICVRACGCVRSSYLLCTGQAQWHTQATGVVLVVVDQLSQRAEGQLVGHKVGSDGGALDPEVVHLALAPGCTGNEDMNMNNMNMTILILSLPLRLCSSKCFDASAQT